ncbi:MAG TPA: sigma-70 family RNA polymerase sigma factor [Acidobacteriota bacterium]|nr:sigma-70 family RNA polymerase sigma factor [Acidobacteriota bacterium]
MGKEPFVEEDRELVGRCLKGEEYAFEELVQRYQQTVFNLVYHSIGYRNDVEDIAQKIFAKIYFSLPKFDNKRPFFPWLYRIAINQCYDELRRARRRKVHTFTELSLEDTESIEKLINQHEVTVQSPEDRQELHALLHKMMEELPDQQKTALVLRDLEMVPYDKMAELMRCTEQAARLKVFRARTRLRELMEKALRRRERVSRGK